MTGMKLDLNKQPGDTYNAGSTDYCSYGKRTARMDIVEEGQCGELTSKIEVSRFGEHRFICQMHNSE